MPVSPCSVLSRGEGIVFFLLSSAAMLGSLPLGVLSLLLSVFAVSMHFTGIDAPPPLFEYVEPSQ